MRPIGPKTHCHKKCINSAQRAEGKLRFQLAAPRRSPCVDLFLTPLEPVCKTLCASSLRNLLIRFAGSPISFFAGV
jgi:hypothetical protein